MTYQFDNKQYVASRRRHRHHRVRTFLEETPTVREAALSLRPRPNARHLQSDSE